jgi:lipoprotein-anchoring transpeptidase ErfK/SrfK
MRERGWASLSARFVVSVVLTLLCCSTMLAQVPPQGIKLTPSPTPTATSTPLSTPKPKPALPKMPTKLSEAELAEGKALLNKLGYWLLVDAAGLDASQRHAVTAFQTVEGCARTGVMTVEELLVLRQAERPKAVDPSHSYIEIDLNRQVLLVVDDKGEVQKILPVSTGSSELFTEGGHTRRAITPTGKFKIQRKIGGWRKRALGLLYFPSYIHDDVAIHGNPSVPVNPASHGCIRIPMFAAKEFFALAPVGT